MELFLNILFLIIGLGLLVKGADFFVSGASAAAKKMKVSPLLIGLTIVSIGTSIPELSVSVISAINHSSDLAVGNIIGSNMFNMLIILGLVATINPVPINISTKKYDIPFLISITGSLLLSCADVYLNGSDINIVSRTESIVLLILYIVYMIILIVNAKRLKRTQTILKEDYGDINYSQELPPDKDNIKDMKVWVMILYIVFGLAAVVFGGECVSSTSQYLALKIGMSEQLVGLTIVAVGTSLPELITSLVAIKKKQNDLAIGNIIGSSVVNIALILGLVGVINQITIPFNVFIDILILFVFTVVFSILCLKGDKLKRADGLILILMYFAYFAFAVIRNYAF